MRVNGIRQQIARNYGNGKSLLYNANISPKMPDVLIYSSSPHQKYMIDTNSQKVVGRMYIDARIGFAKILELIIDSSERNKGYGKKFLDFAQIYSKEHNCGGNLKVDAGQLSDLDLPPHLFYRKYGFSCDDKAVLADLDKHIKENKPLPNLYPMTPMYFISKN